MRQTSIETYHNIINNGLLSKRRTEVYKAVYELGPITANNVIRKYRERYPNVNQTGFNARFSELEKMGVITPFGIEKDPISNQFCTLWVTTDSLPVKLKKEKPKKVIKEETLDLIVKLAKTFPVGSITRKKLKEIYFNIEKL